MLKLLFSFLIYISLGFFAWYLYHFGYLALNISEPDYLFLAISFFLLVSGFILSAFSWGYALKFHGYSVSLKISLISHGLSVFSKYIPGKIWTVLGRAIYVSNPVLSVKTASIVSLKEQLIYIFWGLLISCMPVVFYADMIWFGLLILGSIIFITVILFSPLVHRTFLNISGWIFRRPFQIPAMNWDIAAKISRMVLIYWLIWTVAFYFFLLSAYPEASFLMAYAFPVSVAYGVLAIFMPGGIGVREGIITAFLAAAGIPLEIAVSISVLSRLWFIAGEIFIFIMALVLRIIDKALGYPVYPSTLQRAKPESL